MKQNKIIYTGLAALLFVFCSFCAQAQSERKYVRAGNKLYNKALADTTQLDTIGFSNAEVEYRKALADRPEDLNWQFNLGDALYKQGNFSDAKDIFQSVAESDTSKIAKAKAYHNLGNCYIIEKKLDESIEAYKSALRNNPSDLETKYNLLYAMELKKQQEQQQQQNKQDKDKEEGEQKDDKKDKDSQKNKEQKSKDEESKGDQDKEKKQDQNQDDKQNKDQKQKNQQGDQQDDKISQEDANKLLQALENDEKKTQEKVKKAKAAKGKVKNVDKDW